jgi:nitrogen fixation protein NifU and related proteins
MSDLRDLYQQVILDHQKKPRNFRALPTANRHAEGFNPLCGDKISLFVKMENGVIQEVGFQGAGCAISTASASMMTESVKGKTPAEAEAIFKRFQDLVTSDPHGKVNAPELGKLEVFSGVREFPVRVKCATLAWHTLRAALKGNDKTVSTE